MAASNYGVVPLRFGTHTYDGYIVESVSLDASTEETEITDEIGDIVGVVNNYGKKSSITVETMPKTGTTLILAGATFTINSVEYLIKSVSEKQGKGGVMKYTINATKHGSIDYSP